MDTLIILKDVVELGLKEGDKLHYLEGDSVWALYEHEEDIKKYSNSTWTREITLSIPTANGLICDDKAKVEYSIKDKGLREAFTQFEEADVSVEDAKDTNDVECEFCEHCENCAENYFLDKLSGDIKELIKNMTISISLMNTKINETREIVEDLKIEKTFKHDL